MPMVDDGWGGDGGAWVLGARPPRVWFREHGSDGWGPLEGGYDSWGGRITGEEVIRDIVHTMVADVCENSRAEARSVTAEMLRCAMPANRSPLHQMVSLCRLIDDLQHGRLDPQHTGLWRRRARSSSSRTWSWIWSTS